MPIPYVNGEIFLNVGQSKQLLINVQYDKNPFRRYKNQMQRDSWELKYVLPGSKEFIDHCQEGCNASLIGTGFKE